MELSELSSQQEASLSCSGLEEWQEGPQVLTYGAILICRKGKARLNVNYKDWELYEGAVITLFPNDVVELKVDGDCKSPQTENGDCKSPETENGDCKSPETENGDCKSPQTANSFQVEILKYNPSLLREASLQLEQTVYSSLREDRCRQDTPVVTNIINGMFGLLKVYFDQSECTCISQLVLCQLKAFFIGFHEYLQRNPQYRPDEVKSYRVRELFNRFMMLLERDYKISRDVNYYAEQMNISSKYLTNIVNQVTGHTPKTIIDQYVILQLKMHLKRTTQSIKEMAWEFHFADVSFFCRYFKKHTGLTPQQIRS
ncbi:AraC family transcriptional regulator [Prevotella sp. TF12-30]|uniref:helix-turn-helix domain-containing protein n=1 Tax=Prevotellaceae TaxID=171552 RepID=UPI000E433D7A|nr:MULTISPECIES: helix-turn-helix domain-containing protein [Prevotellaceae]RGK35569.1 AraC family transcriptional regulator [Prevotella sp. TF12-30]